MRFIKNGGHLWWFGIVLCLWTGCSSHSSQEEAKTGQSAYGSEAAAHLKVATSENGIYTGAYIDFGNYEDAVSLESIEKFDALTGKKQAMIASSSFWKQQTFPRKNLDIISAYGAIPVVYWNPWDNDEWNETKKNRFNLYTILEGKHDAYIDMWANEAKAYGKPFLVSWGLEMNGDWFPWSGVFHGAGTPIPGTNPVRYEGPENFKKAYRYVVDRVRARGVTNIEWVFHANNASAPHKPLWNTIASYYPGARYVDWLAISAYGKQFPDEDWVQFGESIQPYYTRLANVDPTKPILIAEWGVGHFPKSGSQEAYVTDALTKFIDPTRFPRLKGAIFWHERWQNPDGSYSNLRVNASDDTLEAYRKSIANPRWIDRPGFIPR